jgi:hypothetical protein
MTVPRLVHKPIVYAPLLVPDELRALLGAAGVSTYPIPHCPCRSCVAGTALNKYLADLQSRIRETVLGVEV